jgi:predicted acetyltransferase
VGQPVEVTLEVVDARESERAVLRRLLELYRYDFSEFDGAEVDDHGEFGYRYLDHYWTDPARHPYLFRCNATWAGFALVRSGDPHDMAEFFVMRNHRRSGLGRDAAHEVLRRFPGRWTVRQQLTNPAAIAFWRVAIPYAFVERQHGGENVMEFSVDEHTPS